MHLHRLGERCRCGHLTVPCRFYWKNEKEVSQEQAEQAYLEHLKEHMPERWAKLVIDHSMEMKKVQTAAFHAVTGRLPGQPHPRPVTKMNNVTPVTKRGRPKKHADQAARQKAYRGRRNVP